MGFQAMISILIAVVFLLGWKAKWKAGRLRPWGARKLRTPGLRRRRAPLLRWGTRQLRTPRMRHRRRRPVVIQWVTQRMRTVGVRRRRADIAARPTVPTPTYRGRDQSSAAAISAPRHQVASPCSTVVLTPRDPSVHSTPLRVLQSALCRRTTTVLFQFPNSVCRRRRTPRVLVLFPTPVRRQRTPRVSARRTVLSREWGTHLNRLHLCQTARTDPRAFPRRARGHAFIPGDPGAGPSNTKGPLD